MNVINSDNKGNISGSFQYYKSLVSFYFWTKNHTAYSDQSSHKSGFPLGLENLEK